MKSFIQKLPILVECMLMGVVALFIYEMYDMCQVMHKPIIYFLVPAFFTVFTSIAYRGREQLSESPELRKYILPLCKPYTWIGNLNKRLWNHIPFGKDRHTSYTSVLYPMFSFLPILPINLAITTCVYMSSWTTISSIFIAICVTGSTFFIVGLISHSAIELSFRLAALVTCQISKRIKE